MSKLSKLIKKVFHPKSGLYSILLGLMSFLAILISLLTLQEMKEQRELSMMPLVRVQDFENKRIHVDSSCVEKIYGDEVRIDQGIADGLEKVLSLGDATDDWFVLNLINLGQGSAVNLEIYWGINFNWFSDYFNALNIDPDIFKFKKMNKSYFFTHKDCSNIGSGISHSTGSSFSKSHLLPASSNINGVKIKIPQVILDLHIAAIKAKWLVEGQNEKNTINLSIDHEFVISYESVSGKKYKEKYKVVLVLTPPKVNTVVKENEEKEVSASFEKFILELMIEKL